MSEYRTVGTDNEQLGPLETPPPLVPLVPVSGNYIEPGISVERQALANAEDRRDENRLAGAPFVIPSPKNYSPKEADGNPAPQPGSDEVRAVGKPFIQKFGE